MAACKARRRPEDGGVTASPPDTALAEVQLGCEDLAPALEVFVGQLGFRIETIFPADDPQVASLSGHGLRLRLAPGGDPGVIRMAGEGEPLIAPNGTRIEFVEADPPMEVPPLKPEFLITRAGEGPAGGTGRAGMFYRDLIPGRLGGRFIASHISIETGGPVADWVHFHKIRFQMIFCRKGWVRLVYEDQGPPFLMQAGDFVLQPPRIRHRVLESSAGLEVVEIGCPALHETLADHAMELPTATLAPDRDFGGQRFLRHVAAQTPWTPHGAAGFEARESRVAAATGGLADVRVIRPASARAFTAPPHDGEFFFGFLLAGSATLDHAGAAQALGPADAFVIPAGEPWGLSGASEDLELLEVMLPAGASRA